MLCRQIEDIETHVNNQSGQGGVDIRDVSNLQRRRSTASKKSAGVRSTMVESNTQNSVREDDLPVISHLVDNDDIYSESENSSLQNNSPDDISRERY